MMDYQAFSRMLFCGVASVGLLPAAALAQAEEEAAERLAAGSEIVVTAQRREQRLTDVPITITNISDETMRRANISELSDIVKVTPGVRFDQRYGFFTPSFRGVTTSVYKPGNPSSIALYLDGFSSPALASANFELMNIENIQVLKGPQGTLFGRNTTGGAVLINTANPSHDTKVTLEAGYGSYNAQRFQGYATTGLSDQVAVDVAARYAQGDGWVENIFTGDDKAGEYQNFNLRVGVLFEPSETFSLLFRYEHTYKDDPSGVLQNVHILGGRPATIALNNPDAIITTKRGKIAEDAPVAFYSKSNAYQLTATLDMGFANLTSYTQYREDKSDHFYSLDLVNLSLGGALSTKEHNKLFTQEFLLNSNSTGRLQWTAGAYYSDWESGWPYVGRAPVGVIGPSTPYPQLLEDGIDSKSIAAFGDVTYELVDGLFLTGGLRYTKDSLKNGFVHFLALERLDLPTLTTSRFTTRGVVRYEFDDNTSVYASVSNGYKAAIYDIATTVFPERPIKPESIWAYEVGFKHASRALSFNIAGYYYDYTNQHLRQSILVDGVPLSITKNAAASEIYGVEADINYRLTDRFSLALGANWNHARFTDFPDAPAFDPITFREFIIPDASGYRMARAPDFTATAGASYVADLGGGALTLSGTLFYTSKIYYGVLEQIPEDAYATLDLRAEWTDPTERYTLAVAGTNVTDTHYLSQVSQTGLGIGANWAPPAQVEASVRVRF